MHALLLGLGILSAVIVAVAGVGWWAANQIPDLPRWWEE